MSEGFEIWIDQRRAGPMRREARPVSDRPMMRPGVAGAGISARDSARKRRDRAAAGARGRRRGLLIALAAALLAPVAHAAPPVESHPLATHLDASYRADLADILERRYLRVLTSNNAFDYYLDGGRRRGFQYEMVRAFVKHLNKRHPPPPGMPKIVFEMIPVADGDLVPMLIAGQGDLIAARLTVTPERKDLIAFSRPYRTVDELVVQRRTSPPIDGLKGLAGKTISVRRSSSYHQSLVAQNQRLRKAGLPPIDIHVVDDALPTERILALVAEGTLERTVADSLLADVAAELHPELQVLNTVRLRQDGRLAWAVQKNAKALLAEVNAFLPRYKEGSLHGNMAVDKYFQSLQPIQRRLEGDPTEISPWDDTFRQLGPRYGFDWRLMAAVAWQESRFDPTAQNRSGATGLFQIKPETAAEPYVDIPDVKGAANVKNNIHAGIKYLAWIKQRYFDPIDGMNEQDRVRMALAAYNAGPRNVARARNRARKMGLDPNRWFRNVELAMLASKKREPVRYVSEINQSYVAYLLLGYE